MSRTLALRVLQLGALLVVIVVVPYKQFELDRFFVPKELVLVATALLAAAILLSRASQLSLGRADELLTLFLALGALSAVFAGNRWSAERALSVTLAGLGCFWSARVVAREGRSRALVAALAAAGVLGAVTALAQAYGLRTDYVSLNRAPGGTFGNRNFMAHLAAITLPALLLTTVRAPTRGALLRWSGGLAAVAAALVLSRSRAAWLALVLSTIVLVGAGAVALARRDGALRLRRLMLALLLAAGGVAAALLLPNTLDWRSDSPYLDTARSVVDYKGGSGRGRLVQYTTSARLALRHPFLGVGPGNWAVAYPRFASERDRSLADDGMTANPWPSSDWVAFAAERGLAATLAFGLALLVLARDAVRTLRTAQQEEERLTASTLLATLTALVVAGAFDAVLLLPIPALIGLALLGALSPPARVRRVVPLPPLRRTLAVLLVAAVGTALAARRAGQLAAISLSSTSSRLSALERASSLDPGNFRIQLRLAEMYIRRGNCRRGRAHALAARDLFPQAPAAQRLVQSCRG